MSGKQLMFLGSIVCVLGMTLSSAAFARVVFKDAFNGNLDNWLRHGGCYDYSFKIVKDPCSDSNNVVQITNIMGDSNITCRKNPGGKWAEIARGGENKKKDDPYRYKHRAELMPKGNNTRVEPNKDFWVGMRSFIPKSFPPRPLVQFHITQIIPAPWRGTDMGLELSAQEDLVMSIRRSADRSRKDDRPKLGKIDRGKWTNWVIHYRRSNKKKTGVVQVWKNNKLVIDSKNDITSQSDAPRGLWKFGLYRSEVVKDRNKKQVYKIYFDDVKIATGQGNRYNEVKPPDSAAGKCVASVSQARPRAPEKLRVKQQSMKGKSMSKNKDNNTVGIF